MTAAFALPSTIDIPLQEAFEKRSGAARKKKAPPKGEDDLEDHAEL